MHFVGVFVSVCVCVLDSLRVLVCNNACLDRCVRVGKHWWTSLHVRAAVFIVVLFRV